MLEGFIDEPFVRRIDFGTLREEKTNTISDDEKERESDAIGSVRVGDTRLYIYILIEFQRTVDPWMPLRFSRYVQRFYDVWQKNHAASEGLPPILPVLLYNGRHKWTAKRSLQQMVHKQISPKYILSLHYLPIIIRGISRKKLARIHNGVSAIFLAEKLDEKHLDETINEIVDIKKTEFPEAKAAIAGWFRSYFQLAGTPDQIVTVLEDTGRTRSMLETTIEKWKQKGVEEGLERGRQEGLQEAKLTLAKRLLERGISLEEIVEVTELSIETVKSLAEDSEPPT